MHFDIRRWAAVIGICLSPFAHGLGLGELTVTSGLGQPFHASIALLGDETNLVPDCFRLQSAGSSLPLPPDAQISLETDGRGHTVLKLKTRLAVHDPIGGFILVAHCSGLLQKEYVFLLDPLPEAERQLLAAADLPAADAPPAAATRPRADARKRPRADTAKAASDSVPAKPSRRARTEVSEQPRLVLSGSTRRLAAATNGSLSLKLDLSLPDPARAAMPLSSTELSDENTALNRKLDHLERQLASLQKRNAALLQQAQAAETPTSPSRKPQSPGLSWSYFLLGLLLLSAALALVLYRRRARLQPGSAPRKADWLPAPQTALPSLFGREKSERAEPRPTPPADAPGPDEELQLQPGKGTEIRDSMKDEVEVFVAHGNTPLAIRLLENHVQQSPAESPVPWLMLLDLLQQEGLAAEYEDTRRQCKQHFNVEIPSLGEIAAAAGKPGLEAYPHVMGELVHLWPSDRAIPYLDELLRDTRNGTRLGFNLTAYNEIVLLRSIREREDAGSW